MVEQGSPEWFALRLGRVTASRIADVMAGGKGITRRKYQVQLIQERLTGTVVEGFTSRSIEQGKEREPQARSFYDLMTDEPTSQIDFVPHALIPMSGASPDLLVGELGLAEFKCPESHTHFDSLMGAKIPRKYTDQVQWQMACTGREWCDWVSFDPTMPPEMQMHIERIECDFERIREIESEVRKFLDEVTEEVAFAEKKFGLAVAA
ncbi:MAG: lambda exonuclease family protein [Hyphomicrobiales bacterium]